MRDPSIHITESNLARILGELGLPNHKELSKRIMKKSKLYPLNNRKISISTKKMGTKVGRVLSSNNSDAELFSNLLLHYRRKLKHRGISQIKQNSRDWLTIKEIVSNANEFCEEFEMDKREGYIKYITIGSSKMAKFMLNKFTNMGSSIIETYHSMVELESDDKPKETESIYDYYVNRILSKTGIPIDYKDKPDKYIHFYKARLLAKKLGVDSITYIKAQFYALEWRSGYPEPIQLVGDKAIQHLNKYLFENNISVNKSKEGKKINWDKIKSLSSDE